MDPGYTSGAEVAVLQYVTRVDIHKPVVYLKQEIQSQVLSLPLKRMPVRVSQHGWYTAWGLVPIIVGHISNSPGS